MLVKQAIAKNYRPRSEKALPQLQKSCKIYVPATTYPAKHLKNNEYKYSIYIVTKHKIVLKLKTVAVCLVAFGSRNEIVVSLK